MKPSNRPITFAILALGVNSITTQIILMRELLVVFYGNEVSIGIILGIWLLMGGLGGWIFGRYSDRIRKKIAVFILGQLALNIFILTSLILTRNIKPLFNILPGEIIPLTTMITSALIILSPICLLLGFLFTLGCRMLKIYPVRDFVPMTNKNDISNGVYREEGAEQVGYVYALDAIGAAFGGLLCNLFLIKIFSSFNIIFFLFILNLFIAIWLLRYANFSPKVSGVLKILILGLLLTLIFLKSTHNLEKVDDWLKRIEWRGFNLLENKNTIYGNLSVTTQDGLYSFFNNGLLMFTVPDLLTQEENTHFAMLQKPDAQTVLLIGGGSSGMLWEILKYPIDAVDYVELDPMVIKLAKKYLHTSEYFSLNNPRVRTINADARFFMQQTNRDYDVIILNLPEPFTAQLNRFYTVEFFRMVKERLTEEGIFYFGLTASENYVGKELEVFLGSIYSTLKEVFVDIKIIPGDTVYFLGATKPDLLTLDYKQLIRRLEKKAIQTKFVREYYLFSKLSKGRLSYITNRLKHAHSVRTNRDFSPVSYYYDMVLWTTYFTHLNEGIKSVFKHINTTIVYIASAILYITIIVLGLLGSKIARRKRSVLIAVATTGFSEISFEVIVVIAFQILYGYLYYKLGLIITSFMVGLSLGAVLITKKLTSIKKPYQQFIKIQLAICLYPLLLPIIFFILHNTTSVGMRAFGSNVIFPLLPIIAGLIGGFQFPLANRIYLEKRRLLGRVAGLSYGADMIGSCIGALLISIFIIPIIGINVSCLLVALLNISSLILLIVNKPR